MSFTDQATGHHPGHNDGWHDDLSRLLPRVAAAAAAAWEPEAGRALVVAPRALPHPHVPLLAGSRSSGPTWPGGAGLPALAAPDQRPPGGDTFLWPRPAVS
jgi:hypothetical protein